MNLLFITFPKAATPFVVAYNLDTPGDKKYQWRVDAVRGVETGKTVGTKGIWGYLHADTWVQITQQEAYARFPELQAAIESWVAPW